MKKEEKLQKILKRAIDNGWKLSSNDIIAFEIDDLGTPSLIFEEGVLEISWNDIIFNHDFAKAFFGYKTIKNGLSASKVSWQYHIKQLAISEDRIEYLYKFIETK